VLIIHPQGDGTLSDFGQEGVVDRLQRAFDPRDGVTHGLGRDRGSKAVSGRISRALAQEFNSWAKFGGLRNSKGT
jgi:hypothetical protein